MKKKDWLIILFIVVISLITLKDLFKPGFYTSHDGIHQIVRLYYFDQDIRNFQIPPRWAAGLLNGFGYPLFVFSYQMPWLIAEPFHLLGYSIFDSIKITFFLGFVLSGITMYLFQKELFNRFAAFIGTFLYLFAPYRFSNIFVRAAIGDATAFIFPPLVFFSAYKLKQSNKFMPGWIVLAAVSLTAILLSHAMVALFFYVSLVFYALYWFVINKKKSFLFSIIISYLLSIGLSAYYLIPSITEKNYTVFTDTLKSVYSDQTFVSFQRLIYSPWGYGTMHAQEGAMSLQIGIAQWVVLITTFIVLLVSIIRRHSDSEKFRETLFFFLLGSASIIMMLPFSSSIWKLASNIIFIDFSWRILVLTVFCISILSGFLISFANKKPLFQVALGCILVIVALYANRNHIHINKSLDWSLPFILKLEKTTNSYDEYTPKWVSKEMVEKRKQKVELINTAGEVNILKDKPAFLDFSVSSSQAGQIKINTIYYPGWTVKVNGKIAQINYNNGGIMEVGIGQGKSEIKAEFKETGLRLVSDILTLVSVSIAALLLYKNKQLSKIT